MWCEPVMNEYIVLQITTPITCLFSRLHRSKSLSVAPLRLRFLTCTLEKTFCVFGPVICRTMYQAAGVRNGRINLKSKKIKEQE